MTFALLLAGFAAVAGAQAPRIDSLSPSQGPIAGGTAVTITGAGFSGASVTLDQKPIAPTSISDTQIRLVMPQHDNGYALIQVALGKDSSAAEFLYVPPKLKDLPPGYITTIAGVGDYLRFHLPANTASIRAEGIAVDSKGNILFGWPNANRILRVRNDGILEPFAGDGTFNNGPNGDSGPATAAWISFCRTVSLDAAGNAYIPDEPGRIRRVDAATGIISTIAGTGVAGFSGDGGQATQAQFDHVNYVVADDDGTVYFTDHGNARIRRVTVDGIISTVAGNGTAGDSGDGGPATEAQLAMQQYEYDTDAIALDRARQLLYFAEYFAGKVRRIDLRSGIITTFFAGSPPAVPFVNPWSLAVDSAGNLYVGTTAQIVKLDPAARVVQTWGNRLGFSEDGTPLSAMLLGQPFGLAIEADGNILFSDSLVARLRRMNLATGKLETVAGIAPRPFGVPGPANAAVLTGPTGDVAFLPSGDLLFGDPGAIRIFRIDLAGQITIFGGTGMYLGPGPGDGVPIADAVIAPAALSVDRLGAFYLIDSGLVIYVDRTGFTHRIAGAGYGAAQSGFAGDGGPAEKALLTQPSDVALDRDGNLFIADTNNNRIRRIDAKTNVITTVAGAGPTNGFEGYSHGAFCGDGGPAIEACFNTPFGVAVDPDGNLFIGDTSNSRLRKVSTTGIIATFSDMTGIGTFNKLLADAYGGLFAQTARQIWRFLPDGSSWPVAGTGEAGFAGDGGPASSAKMWDPSSGAGGIDSDSEGNLVFHDSVNRRIRAVRFGAVLAPPNAQVLATLGSLQSASLMKTFGAPLEVTVRTAPGSPGPGVRVDFAAPAGPVSCVFSNGKNTISAVTDRSGRARASCTASCRVGSYTVLATPLGLATTVPFSLTNTPSPSGRSRCTTVVPPRSPIP